MKFSLISSVIAFVQVAALELRESCGVREKTLDALMSTYSKQVIDEFRQQDPEAVQLDTSCLKQNVCALLDDDAFEKYLCCLETTPDSVETLKACENHLHHCCNREDHCCPGDDYTTNPNCDCDRLTQCCNLWGDEDAFPFNLNCYCDPLVYCCEGKCPCNREI